MEKRVMEPADLLKKPYARLVMPGEDGSFTAEIVEFPGCIASGRNTVEALANLEEVAVDWIAVTLQQGQDIPEPMDAAGYSGKLVLRMPKGLHKKAALCASRDGSSLNQFIVTCVAEAVGARARQAVTYSIPQFHAVANMSVQVVGGDIMRGHDRFEAPATLQGFSPRRQIDTGSSFVGVPNMRWQEREWERA